MASGSLKDKIQLIDRKLLTDDRGWFLKVLNGKEDFLPMHTGEIYMTMAKPGQWRANHYHPATAEWFTVFSGEAKVILEDIETRERMILHMHGTLPKTLFVPPGIAHVFINASETTEMLLVVYSANPYDPTDTVSYNLIN